MTSALSDLYFVFHVLTLDYVKKFLEKNSELFHD